MGPALHIHPHALEAYYVLEGEYSIQCNNRVYQVKAGDFVFIPKGCPHTYQSGPTGGKALVISPAGLEKYFREVAHILHIGHFFVESSKSLANRAAHFCLQ
jgi:quercetin dioxygenase-like cupin family protein